MPQSSATKAKRPASASHLEYLDRMRAFFTSHQSHALLLRGAEGEAVAHPRREPMIEWLDGKTAEVWRGTAEENPELPGGRDAAVTAAWIGKALSGKQTAPAAIVHQTASCIRAAAA